eukprot:s992_g10.t1
METMLANHHQAGDSLLKASVEILKSALDAVKAMSSKWTVSENLHGVKHLVLQSNLPPNSQQTRRFWGLLI